MQDLKTRDGTKTLTAGQSFAQKAMTSHRIGMMLDAIQYAEMAINIEPENDAYLHMIGVIYQHHGDNKNAVRHFNKAISINKRNFTYFYNLGIVYKETGETENSLKMLRSALNLSEHNLSCLNEIGLVYSKLNRLDEAETALKKAFSIAPYDITTCINLSHIYVEKKDVREAINFANKAIQLDPNRAEPYCNIGTAFVIANVIDQGIDYLKTAKSLSQDPDKASFIHQSILMNMLYADCYSPETIFEEHKNWANTHLDQNINYQAYSKPDNTKNKILKIGFVSGDFSDHSIAHFLIPLLENINNTKFKIFCYSSTTKTDKVTDKFKQLSSVWRDISNADKTEVIRAIKNDGIDILIDLAGHSFRTNIGIFSHKPAPIQMTYLGYPFSSGMKSMDYRITDQLTDPENITEHLHTEKLLRIEPSFLCYKPEIEAPITKTLPVEKNGYITFGSFNNFCKLSNSTIKTWADILLNVPNSKIFLKSTLPIPDGLRDTVLSSFEKYGIQCERIIMHHATTKKTEHMDLYNGIDICLDPFPYNGTTTTYEALSMGVPVVALTGTAHYSRVSYGILSNLGCQDLSANSLKEYINIAVRFASDRNALRHYRKTLRPALLSSALTDAEMYSKKFETLLNKAWHTYCSEQL